MQNEFDLARVIYDLLEKHKDTGKGMPYMTTPSQLRKYVCLHVASELLERYDITPKEAKNV